MYCLIFVISSLFICLCLTLLLQIIFKGDMEPLKAIVGIVIFISGILGGGIVSSQLIIRWIAQQKSK